MVVVLKMYHKGNDGSPVHGLAKRRPEMGAQGFTGDSFNGESWDKQLEYTIPPLCMSGRSFKQ